MVTENSLGEGVLKAKILEELEFLGGSGSAKQKPSMRHVWIFSGTTHNFDVAGNIHARSHLLSGSPSLSGK